MDEPWNKRIRAVGAICLCVSIVGGCAQDEGILIEVTRAETDVSLEEIDRLEFRVGTDAIPGTDVFLPDPDLRDVEFSSPRDLSSRPYRLFLESGDLGEVAQADARVIVVIFAWSGTELLGSAALAEPVAFGRGEVHKYTMTLAGGASPFESEGNCIKLVHGEEVITISSPDDKDCDGDLSADDCDDFNANVGPSRGETCANNIDDDCDLVTDEVEDGDGDLFANCTEDGQVLDCDDSKDFINPGADEICDGLDNNCNGSCDEVFADEDGDGYLVGCNTVRRSEAGQNFSCREVPAPAEDCDDSSELVHPEREEICDGLDNNCDYFCDEVVRANDDGDGFAECEGLLVQAGPGSTCAVAQDDCDVKNAWTYPGAAERCDSVDQDCDGSASFAGDVLCPANGDTCMLGTSECTVTQGGDVSVGECVPLGGELSKPIPNSLCDVVPESCGEAGIPEDEWGCLLAQVEVKEIECEAHFAPTQEGVNACPGMALGGAGVGLTECTWSLLDSLGSYAAELKPEGCKVSMTLLPKALEQSIAVGNGLMFVGLVAAEKETVYRVSVYPVSSAECPAEPLQCTGELK